MTSSPDDSALPRSGPRPDGHTPAAGPPARSSPADVSRSTASSDTEAAPSDGVASRAANGDSPDITDRGRPDDGDTRPREIGGQAGPEPTRYGDWEKKGRCTDF